MAFATTADVAARLMRTLTAEEDAAAEWLLDAVTAEIVAVTGYAEVDLDPDRYKFVTVEAVCRELASPVGAESTAETLGQYSYRVGYRETGGTLLTEQEKLEIRRLIGEGAGSVRVKSLVHDTYVTEP